MYVYVLYQRFCVGICIYNIYSPAPPGATEKKKGPDAKKPKPKKDDTTEYLPLPDKLKNMSKEQGGAFSKKCYTENVCKNCGGCDSRFPAHKSFSCPQQCRWAPAWPDGHVAVKMTSASGETIMNPVLPASESVAIQVRLVCPVV